jgi:hypothetical protein
MWNPFDALAKLFSSATPEQPNKAGGSPPPRDRYGAPMDRGGGVEEDYDDDDDGQEWWPDDDEPVELLDDDDKPAATSMPPVLGDLGRKGFQAAVDSFLDSQEPGLEKQQPRTTKNDDGEISWPDSMSNDFEYHGEDDSLKEEWAAFMQPPRLPDQPELSSSFATADEFLNSEEYGPPARSRKHRTRKYDKPDSLQDNLAEFMAPTPTDGRTDVGVGAVDTTWGQINVMDMLDAVAQADASAKADASQDIFEPIKPPETLFEEVVESLASFVAKIAGIDVPDRLTSVQALLEQIFGRPKTESNAPETISEAINPLGETGPLNRTGGQGGALGKAADVAVTASSIANTARSAGGAAGGAAAAAAGFLTAIIGVIAALKALASQSYQTALRLAEFDGGIMGAKVQLEIGDLLRDIVKADALSEAAVENLDAENRLKQAMLPYEIWFNNMGLNLGTWAKDRGTEFLDNPIGNAVEMSSPILMLLGSLGFDVSDQLKELNDKVLEGLGFLKQDDLEAMLAGHGQMPLHDALIRPLGPPPPLVVLKP